MWRSWSTPENFCLALLMNLKNNYLLKKLLKWTNKKTVRILMFTMYLKKKKIETAGDIIILHLYTKNPDDMIHSSWDIECGRLKLVIMGHFMLFTPPPYPKKACISYFLSNFYFFTNWWPLKNYEKCFLFHLKTSFCSRDIQIFVIFSLPFYTFQIQKDKWKWNNLWCHELACINLQMQFLE